MEVRGDTVEAEIILTGRHVVEHDRQRICALIQNDLDQHEGLQSKGLRVLNVEIRDDLVAKSSNKRGSIPAYCAEWRAKVGGILKKCVNRQGE